MDDGTKPDLRRTLEQAIKRIGDTTTRPAWHWDDPVYTTRCKHGAGDCDRCGTSNRRDVIHTARTPGKREMRRKRRKGK